MRIGRGIGGALVAAALAALTVGPSARTGERRGRLESAAAFFNRAEPKRARPEKDPNHPAVARAKAKRFRRGSRRLREVFAGGWHRWALVVMGVPVPQLTQKEMRAW